MSSKKAGTDSYRIAVYDEDNAVKSVRGFYRVTNPDKADMMSRNLELQDVKIQGIENKALDLDDEKKINEQNGHLQITEQKRIDAETEGEYPKGEPEEERSTWGNKLDFLLSIIGFAVDLANVWRFPYLCYKNGGGAFLIPYFSMLIFGAVPLFYMELLLGQFHRQGAVTLWKIAPLFKGIGWGIILVSYWVAVYYNVIIAWAFYFLFSSFTAKLPWTGCDNEWNTCKCWDGTKNITVCDNVTLNASTAVSASAEYFDRGVLEIYKSTGIDDLGEPRWQLALCVVLVFTILYLALFKGVHSSGKVVWVTATAPYVILLILMINGFTLEGAGKGIEYFIIPRFDRLGDPGVWIDAAIQIFYSVGAGFGVHLAYASYNKFHNNCYRDVLITAGVNSFTSLFSGFVIFSYLGYMSVKSGIDIDKVATDGPGLVFVVYPEAISTLPGSTAWAIIFFLMLITLGLDSSMGGMESVLTGLKDQFKDQLKKIPYSREVLTAVVIAVACLISLVNVTYGGIYIFHILNQMAAGTSLLFFVLMENVCVIYIYGMDQFKKDAKQMLGFTPGIFWRVCWKFISPIFVLGIIIASIATYMPLQYPTASGFLYTYPSWANAIGWCIAASSMVLVPLVAIYKFATARGKTLSQKFATTISPEWEHDEILQGGEIKRYRLKHWITI